MRRPELTPISSALCAPLLVLDDGPLPAATSESRAELQQWFVETFGMSSMILSEHPDHQHLVRCRRILESAIAQHSRTGEQYAQDMGISIEDAQRTKDALVNMDYAEAERRMMAHPAVGSAFNGQVEHVVVACGGESCTVCSTLREIREAEAEQ